MTPMRVTADPQSVAYNETMTKTAFVSAALFFVTLSATALAAGSPSADQLFARGNFTAARAAYAKSLGENPRDIAANVGIARVALYENDLNAAEASARLALTLDPKNAAAQSVLTRIAGRRAVGVPARRPRSRFVRPAQRHLQRHRGAAAFLQTQRLFDIVECRGDVQSTTMDDGVAVEIAKCHATHRRTQGTSSRELAATG